MISREGMMSGVWLEANCSDSAEEKCFRTNDFGEVLEVLDEEITGWASGATGMVDEATLAGSAELEDPVIAFGA
jgi:hypothetical protein